MTRRARGKFKMKGHSIPGIQGCKTTTLEDGRAASSAFQMKSPLQEAETELEFDDPTKDMDLTGGLNKSREQLDGESGYAYAMRQAALLRERRKDKKEKEKKKEEDPSGVQEDQTTKYDEELPQVKPLEGPEIENPLADDVEIKELSVPEVKPRDYSGASKNEMTNIRKQFKEDGSWDPKGNPEHANIQNKINELYGSPKRY